MGEEQKKALEQQLWNIANELRGKMDADEFRDYILGFIFYKYLSEKIEDFADELLQEDSITYTSIDEATQDGQELLDGIKEDCIEQLGYFLKPNELFSAMAKKGNEESNNFILEDLTEVLRHIESSTMGHESEDDFEHLFEDLDLTSTKLGRTEEAKNGLISKVLAHLDNIDFELKNHDRDVLGDAYEYLIAQFASGAGKKAGEFYTPQEVSKILAKIVTNKKVKLKSVYDPTCGSGSLLLRVAKEVEDVSNFYGQELNRTTYNLARMNMIMHDVHYRKFDIKQEDTLEHPQHIDEKFEAIVANPPFSAKWSANPLHMSDDRFSQYGKLAPASKADFAFVQHMIHHLDDNGTMAIVLPHGVLFRGAAEGHIRKYLIEDRHYLDAVIGLPANIFYGTSIPTCILVFKKCREDSKNVLFIDSSKHFEKAKNQNYLRNKDIEKIISTYENRIEENKYSYLATTDEIKKNDYNLNIPRYVDTFEDEESINLNSVVNHLDNINKLSNENDIELFSACNELGLPKPLGNNISLLIKYKKGVMQKLFSQQVKFKNNENKKFLPWEEKNGNDIFKTVVNKNHNSDLPILAISQEFGAVPRDIIDYNVIVSEKSISSYKIVEIGDYIISLRSFQGGIEYSNYKGICSPAYIILRPFINVDRDFYRHFFKTEIYIKLLNKNIEGIRDGKMVSFKQFSEVKLPYPSSIEEQTKIANFLTLIDKKIEYNKKEFIKTN